MTKIKICGIANLDDALASARAGADLIGLNFYKPGPRYIDPVAAGRISVDLRHELGERCPLIVGVFVNEQVETLEAIRTEAGLDLLQLHGDEPPAVLAALGGLAFKALRPASLEEALAQVERYLPAVPHDPRAPSLLLDAHHPKLYGGTGQQASTQIAGEAQKRLPQLMLAGGLTPENVGARVAAIKPWGVDVASGVEDSDPRHKDHDRIRRFVDAVRAQSEAL
jgi:phosphoribosylanthranilate isomerase